MEVVPRYEIATKFTEHAGFLFRDFESVHQSNIWLSAATVIKSEIIFNSLDVLLINTMPFAVNIRHSAVVCNYNFPHEECARRLIT